MILPVTETRFECCGYPCVVLFMPMGHRCGYAGIPKTHPDYRKDYDDLYIECHGDLTYAEPELYNQDDEETWWFGFDCNHIGDSPDKEAMLRLFPDYYENFLDMYRPNLYRHCVPRTLEYATEQCRLIAKQLKEREGEND